MGKGPQQKLDDLNQAACNYGRQIFPVQLLYTQMYMT